MVIGVNGCFGGFAELWADLARGAPGEGVTLGLAGSRMCEVGRWDAGRGGA